MRFLAVGVSYLSSMKVPELTERLHELKMPVLAFWGVNERMMPESGILKLAKNVPDKDGKLPKDCKVEAAAKPKEKPAETASATN